MLVVQLFASLAVPARSARTFVTFAGDAGSLAFGAALMACFFVPPGHKLHRDWLRWGFLFLGAASFADTFGEWWTARTNPSTIAFGQFEHGELTDASKLVTVERWAVPDMVGRYVTTGVLGLLALAVLQFLHVQRTRRALADLEGG